MFDRDGQELPAPETRRERSAGLPRPLPFDGGCRRCASICADGRAPSVPRARAATVDVRRERQSRRPAPAPPPRRSWPRAVPICRAPLDSKIDRCQWHRVVLHGDAAAGHADRVEHFCADEEYDADQLGAIRSTWPRAPIADASRSVRDLQSDCLVRSAPGRYLWLRLDASKATASATPSIRRHRDRVPAAVSSLRYLPAVFARRAGQRRFHGALPRRCSTRRCAASSATSTPRRGCSIPLSAPADARRQRRRSTSSPGSRRWIGVTFDRNWNVETAPPLPQAAPARCSTAAERCAGLREQLLHAARLRSAPSRAATTARPRRVLPRARRRTARRGPSRRPCRLPPLMLEHFRLRRWLRVGKRAARRAGRAVGRAHRQPHAARRERRRLGAHGS